MRISPASTADFKALIALVNSAYRGDSARSGWTHEADLIQGEKRVDAAELQEMLDKPGAMILCAFEADALTGCVYVKDQGDDLYLGMLSVDPLSQGQGIGRKLMEAAFDHARMLKKKRIVMTVITLRDELIKWYQDFGFVDTGLRSNFPSDGKFGTPLQPLQFAEFVAEVQGH